MTQLDEEHVVLVDESGAAIGTAPKRTVHHESTPLHLAFSCYVFGADGRLLLTQRAPTKRTWPDVWTNTACGHPASGETAAEAVRRRCDEELGLQLEALRLVLPAFRYRAVMSSGVVENELCPVFTATIVHDPVSDPSEVAATEWVDWAPFRDDVLTGRRAVSPWCVEQVRALVELGPDPSAWPTRDESELPPAAR